jgi:hypothetical protein
MADQKPRQKSRQFSHAAMVRAVDPPPRTEPSYVFSNGKTFREPFKDPYRNYPKDPD